MESQPAHEEVAHRVPEGKATLFLWEDGTSNLYPRKLPSLLRLIWQNKEDLCPEVFKGTRVPESLEQEWVRAKGPGQETLIPSRERSWRLRGCLWGRGKVQGSMRPASALVTGCVQRAKERGFNKDPGLVRPETRKRGKVSWSAEGIDSHDMFSSLQNLHKVYIQYGNFEL